MCECWKLTMQKLWGNYAFFYELTVFFSWSASTVIVMIYACQGLTGYSLARLFNSYSLYGRKVKVNMLCHVLPVCFDLCFNFKRSVIAEMLKVCMEKAEFQWWASIDLVKFSTCAKTRQEMTNECTSLMKWKTICKSGTCGILKNAQIW